MLGFLLRLHRIYRPIWEVTFLPYTRSYWKSFKFLINMRLAVYFWRQSLPSWESSPLLLVYLECWVLSNALSTYVDTIMWFFLVYQCGRTHWVLYVELILHNWDIKCSLLLLFLNSFQSIILGCCCFLFVAGVV